MHADASQDDAIVRRFVAIQSLPVITAGMTAVIRLIAQAANDNGTDGSTITDAALLLAELSRLVEVISMEGR